MLRRSSFVVLSVLVGACGPKEAEPTTTPEPVTSTPEPEPASELTATETDDPLTGLELGPTPTAAPGPEPIEVVVDAVIVAEKLDAKVIEVGVDPRFTIQMQIEHVEPQTPLLVPDHYAVMIHSPSKTFRGPVPGKGERIRFRMTIVPATPGDLHDETFFSDLWID